MAWEDINQVFCFYSLPCNDLCPSSPRSIIPTGGEGLWQTDPSSHWFKKNQLKATKIANFGTGEGL